MSAERSGEKTEKATPKRRRDARENAQVLKSAEMITALTLLVLFGTLSIFGDTMIGNLKLLLTTFFSAGKSVPDVMTPSSISPPLLKAVEMMALIAAPMLIAAFLAGLVFNYLQVGFLFTPKMLKPKFERISPLAGLKRIFSKKTLAQLVKSTIKVVILGAVAYEEYQAHISEMPGLMWQSVPEAAAFIARLLLNTAFKLAIALAIFAPIDYFYEWRKREKELMMTKQEVKEEFKMTEGDPQIKGKIRQKQRQISGMRMIQAVQTADVVITNPTHYAIALSYDDQKHGAPVVVAKGKDYLAQKIREKAKECQIEMVENRPLAQALYFYCEIGDEVPEEMYQAVAEILAYVYRLKNKLGREKN